jgi:hypothetical protein
MPEKKSQSISSDRISESTIARIAGNVIGHLAMRREGDGDNAGLSYTDVPTESDVANAVAVARAIAAEVRRTSPPSPGDDA